MLGKVHLMAFLVVCAGLLLLPGKRVAAATEYVQIADKGNYFLVTIDAQSASPSAIGSELGSRIRTAVVDIESLIDSYIAEGTESDSVYDEVLQRVNHIRSQVQMEYQDEVDAMSAALNPSGTPNVRGDGKLSRDEVWLMNLITDVARSSQCSAVGVSEGRSVTSRTMVARLLDWDVGSSNQLAKIQAVYKINNGNRSITTIGFLGLQAVLSGYNDDNVFVSILDSPTGVTYSAAGKRSYAFDLRYALENEDSLVGIANYMTDPSRNYAFNHIIFMADQDTAAALENNFSGTGSNMRRALRDHESALNDGIAWGFIDAVASVNAFMLDGNHDNFTGDIRNTARWGSIRSQLSAKGATVTWAELKEIATYDGGDGPGAMESGDIYSEENIQVILFEPSTGRLEVAFHPKTGSPTSNPMFDLVCEGLALRHDMPWIPLLLLGD